MHADRDGFPERSANFYPILKMAISSTCIRYIFMMIYMAVIEYMKYIIMLPKCFFFLNFTADGEKKTKTYHSLT